VVGAAVLAVGWAHKSVVVWWFLVDGRAGFKFLCFPWWVWMILCEKIQNSLMIQAFIPTFGGTSDANVLGVRWCGLVNC